MSRQKLSLGGLKWFQNPNFDLLWYVETLPIKAEHARYHAIGPMQMTVKLIKRTFS